MLYSSSFDALKKSLVGVHKYIQVKVNFFPVIPILLDLLPYSVLYLDHYTLFLAAALITVFEALLRIRIREPVPFLTPGFWIKNG